MLESNLSAELVLPPKRGTGWFLFFLVGEYPSDKLWGAAPKLDSYSILEIDHELSQAALPFFDWHGPFLGRLLSR